jgi:hypothetical protein
MTVDDVNALQRWLCMKWWVHYKDQVGGAALQDLRNREADGP